MKHSVLVAFLAGMALGGVGFATIGVLAQDHGQHSHHAHGTSDASSEAHPFIRDMERDMAKMWNDMHSPGYTGNWDIDFLAMMIPHHRGAIDMAKLELVHGKDPLSRMLAQEIIAPQQVDIDAMKARLQLLRTGPADSSVDEYPPLSGTRGSARVASAQSSDAPTVASANGGGDQQTRTLTPASPKNTSFASMKQVNAGVLNVGYAEDGPADGQPVILLHGWPFDIYAFVDVAPLLAKAGYRVIVPYQRGYGSTTFLSPDTFRNAQQSICAEDVVNLMDALKIKKAILGGFDIGSRTAAVAGILWPDRVKALVLVSGYLIANVPANALPAPPRAEYAFWYQWYFSTKRGVLGYTQNTYDFNKLVWSLQSPKWHFDDATFDRTAASYKNPDHVAIVIHNYRWRIGLASGDPTYDGLETKLYAGPVITQPTITIASDFDGANASGTAYRNKFTGKYSHQILNGIGHDVPQEAPDAFADAIIEVAGY
jgi:pimeloyl-ACP methyl ester carboxylesterase